MNTKSAPGVETGARSRCEEAADSHFVLALQTTGDGELGAFPKINVSRLDSETTDDPGTEPLDEWRAEVQMAGFLSRLPSPSLPVPGAGADLVMQLPQGATVAVPAGFDAEEVLLLLTVGRAATRRPT